MNNKYFKSLFLNFLPYFLMVSFTVFFVFIFLKNGFLTFTLPELLGFFRDYKASCLEFSQKCSILELRILRLGACLLVGAFLASSGSLLQRAFSNPLVDSHFLGMGAGAILGVAVLKTILIESDLVRGDFVFIRFIAAVVGSLSVVLVYLVLRKFFLRNRNESVFVLPLVGICINTLLSAAIGILMAIKSPNEVWLMTKWSQGDLQIQNFRWLLVLGAAVLVSLFGFFRVGAHLKIMAFGRDFLLNQTGIEEEKIFSKIFIYSAIGSAASVAMVGNIAFVGILIPQIVHRFRIINPHKEMIFIVFLGAFFLSFCDLISRVYFSRYDIPVGVFTACLGAPFLMRAVLRLAHDK